MDCENLLSPRCILKSYWLWLDTLGVVGLCFILDFGVFFSSARREWVHVSHSTMMLVMYHYDLTCPCLSCLKLYTLPRGLPVCFSFSPKAYWAIVTSPRCLRPMASCLKWPYLDKWSCEENTLLCLYPDWIWLTASTLWFYTAATSLSIL